MTENLWHYKRGHWYGGPADYPESARAKQAKDRLRKWELQRRWRRWPKLGPVPEKWMDVGPPPTSTSMFLSEALTAFYTDAISHQLNSSSVLLKYLDERS